MFALIGGLTVLRLQIVTFLLDGFAFGEIPADIKPINVYDIEDTKGSAAFVGTQNDAEERKLYELQGVTKINNNYYVYSRDNIFVLDIRKSATEGGYLPYTQMFEWTSDEETIKICRLKGKSAEKCRNFVKLIIRLKAPSDSNLNRVLACATNAFGPVSRYFQLGSDGSLVPMGDGFTSRMTCPHNPDHNSASLATDGNLYTATPIEFRGTRSIFHRTSIAGSDDKNLTTRSDSNAWINSRSHIIRIIDAGERARKVLLFYRETAIEDNSYQTYSRVGQSCKNDEGNARAGRLFTSFFKTRLNCSLPGHPPFYFNELYDVTHVVRLPASDGSQGVDVVFTVMNTPRNSIPASAVCAFALSDIEDAFNGAFWEKYSAKNGLPSYWGKQKIFPIPRVTSCNPDVNGEPRNLNITRLNFALTHPMMHSTVNAWNVSGGNYVRDHLSLPVLTRYQAGMQLTSISVDENNFGNGHFATLVHTVLVAGTEDGKIVKILLLPSRQATVVEERMVYHPDKCGQTGDRKVIEVKIDKENGVMLVSFRSCILSVPLCPLLTTCERKCLASRDPYCRWSGTSCQSIRSNDNERQQDLVGDDVTRIPDCPPPPVLVTSQADQDFPIGKNVNGTGDDISGNSTSDVIIMSAAASVSDSWIFRVMMGFVVGIMVGVGITIAFRFCGVTSSRDKNLPEQHSAVEINGVAGKVVAGQNENSRHEHEQKNGRVSRHQSTSSRPRSGGQYEQQQNRKRRFTESSSKSTPSDEEFVPTQTPDSPSHEFADQPSHHNQPRISTSSKGGNGKTRHHSTAISNCEDPSPHKQRNHTQPGSDDHVFIRQISAEDQEPLIAGTPSGTLPGFPRQHPAGVHRSVSLQGPPPFHRGMSMSHTPVHGGVRGFPINRQHSLQGVPRPPVQVVYATAQPGGGYRIPTPQTPRGALQWTPQTPMQGPVPVTQTAQERMTHSLDRKKLIKHTPYTNSQPGGAFGDDPYADPSVVVSQRKRYASESQKLSSNNPHASSNMNQFHPPTPFHPIQEEPRSPDLPSSNPMRPRRDNLTLDLQPNPHPHPFDPITPARQLSRSGANYSNPGTPQGDYPPFAKFEGQRKMRHPPPPRLELAGHHVIHDVSPMPSPGHAPQGNYPFHPIDRQRHASGPQQKVPTPTSPVRTLAPSLVAFPPNIPTPVGARGRHPSDPATQQRNPLVDSDHQQIALANGHVVLMTTATANTPE